MIRITLTAALLAASITTAQAQCRDQFECLGQRIHGERTRAADASEAARQAAEAAETARQIQAQDRIAAERQRQQDQADRAQAAIEAQPINRLYRGYQRYAFVQFCHQMRAGYVVQFVNEVELARANIAIKAIVAQVTAEDASLDTDLIWQKALRSIVGQRVNDDLCHGMLRALFRASPEPVYAVEKPE